MSLRTCENCGKQFDGIANARYCCPECRQIGADRKRREWERRTGYDVKNRAKANAWRARKAAEAVSERTDQKPVPVSNNAQKAVKRHNPAHSPELERMIKAKMAGDLEGYLLAFRDYEKSLVPSGESETKINGISVNHPCFVDFALSEILETGRIILSKE